MADDSDTLSDELEKDLRAWQRASAESLFRLERDMILEEQVVIVEQERPDMSIPIPDCDFCHESQNVLGACFYGPPDADNKCDKLHCCAKCWDRLLDARSSQADKQNQLDEVLSRMKSPDPEAATILEEHLWECVGSGKPEPPSEWKPTPTIVTCTACKGWGTGETASRDCLFCGGKGWLMVQHPPDILSGNIDRAVQRAIQEPTLAKALSWICLWESERAIHQARHHHGTGSDGRGWDTCFEFCIEQVLKAYKGKPDEVPGQADTGTH